MVAFIMGMPATKEQSEELVRMSGGRPHPPIPEGCIELPCADCGAPSLVGPNQQPMLSIAKVVCIPCLAKRRDAGQDFKHVVVKDVQETKH